MRSLRRFLLSDSRYSTCSIWAASLLSLAVLVLLSSCAAPTPPVAAIQTKTDTLFSDVRTDDYYWLRERDNPEVISYLEAENAYTNAVMKSTQQFQETLFEEMKSRIEENDYTVPVRKGDWYYYERTEAGKEYPIHLRRGAGGTSPEQVVLDENTRAAGKEYYEAGVYEISPSQGILAFAEDTTGRETYTLYFKDVDDGSLYPDKVDSVYYSGAWGGDNQTFFYVTLDDALRPWRVWRHRLGTLSSEDLIVFEEPDDRFFLEVNESKDQKVVMIHSESESASEVYVLPSSDAGGEFRSLQPRRDGVLYYAEHLGDRFLIRTNDTGVNFRLVDASENRSGYGNWREILPARRDVLLEDFDVFTKAVVLYERENALRHVCILNVKSGKIRTVPFDEEIYTVRNGENPDYNSDSLRVMYTSMITPVTIYDVNLESLERTVRKRDEVGGGYDPEQYKSFRAYAPARDGETIPISILMQKDTPMDGSAPLLLYGYGAYGYTYDPRFNSRIFSLIDRGFIFANAHVRGSSAKGRMWYENGKMMHKMNTFTDFIDVGEYLVKEGYTSSDRLTALGGSAGGLTMGAVANMRPDLFRAIVAAMPFVDVINTMLDESIPLTVTEYEEWGNPHVEAEYSYMRQYSPYDNVSAQAYPDLLIEAGLNDPRVQYWEPAKWTAKLRAMKTDDNRLLLWTNMSAGHQGTSGRYGRLHEAAFEYAFLLTAVGIDK
ncbi:MAG: S9 family peptidase [bacterium]